MKKFMAGVAVAALLAGTVFLALTEGPSEVLITRQLEKTLTAIVPAAGDISDVALSPHKAVYDFRMLGISSGGGLSDIRGSMFYEQGDACDAWTTDHRFTSEYFYPERPSVVNASQYVSWESKDGAVFQFNSERQENGTDSKQLRGSVERAATGTTLATFARPPELSFDLPEGYYLPTRHTIEMIRRARAGDKIFHAVLFDGTDDEGPVEVNTVITRKATAEEITAVAKRAPEIDTQLLIPEAWHMRMAVFPLVTPEGEDGSTASYEMDMLLHANGVISEAIVDYKQFKVAQRLTALDALPPPNCSDNASID